MKRISVVLLAIMMLLFTACGGEKPEETVKNTVNNALNAVKSFDVEAMQKYFSEEDVALIEDQAADDAEKYTKQMFGSMTFTLKEISVTDNSATAAVEITNVDMQKLMEEYMQNAMAIIFSGVSEEEMEKQVEEMLFNLLDREDNATVMKPVVIELEQKDSKWNVKMTDELLDAILGGLISMDGMFDDEDVAD